MIQLPRQSRWLSRIGWLGFAVCAVLLLSGVVAKQEYFDTSEGVREKFHSGRPDARSKIAVLDISGLIFESDGFVKRQIERIRHDPNVRAVVVRVNSPGGTVTASDYIYHHLMELREQRKLPIVVSMGSIATSGGYYVSMAVGDQPDTVFAEPTTTTGSIGVIIPHYDFSGLLARFDVKDDSIATHPRKELLSLTKPMSDEDRTILQRYVTEAFNRFKKIVLSGRPKLKTDDPLAVVDAATGADLATGEIFTANQALEYGLVDRIGFIEDAITRAAELAGVSPGQYRAVEYQRPPGLLDIALAQQLRAPDNSQFAHWLEWSSPRAWYVSSSLAPLWLATEGME